MNALRTAVPAHNIAACRLIDSLRTGLHQIRIRKMKPLLEKTDKNVRTQLGKTAENL